MHIKADLGAVIKAARIKEGIKQEKLAEMVDVGLRHIQGIENEGNCPSFEVLYKIVRVLRIPADRIFYPESAIKNPQVEEILLMLYSCDERSLSIISAAAKAALEGQPD